MRKFTPVRPLAATVFAALLAALLAACGRTCGEAGAGNFLDVLDAERTDLKAQDALAQSRTETVAAWIDVYRSLAGGWPTRLPERRAIAKTDNGASTRQEPSP